MLVCDWGVNDVDCCVYIKQELTKNSGKRSRKIIWYCPYYQDWTSMLKRCLAHKYQSNKRTYHDCTICEEWRHFSNFIKWVDSQPNRDWQNCHLDKDLLVYGNKHYSPETCVYVKGKLNTFITDNSTKRGQFLIGVTHCKTSKINPYQVQCNNPITGKRGYVGIFPTELEAHKAWQAKKHEYACELADLQDDPRVADALRQRYSPDKDWTKR